MHIDRESQLAQLRHREQLREALRYQAARAALSEEPGPMYFVPHTSSWGLLRIGAILLLVLALTAYAWQAAAPRLSVVSAPQGQILGNAPGNAAENDPRMDGR